MGECDIEAREHSLCNLLFEELVGSIQTNLPPQEKVTIKISKGSHSVSVLLKTHSDSNFLEEDLSPSLSDGDEIEQKIRNAVLARQI